MRVLGVNAVFHDPAAALVVDGQVVAAWASSSSRQAANCAGSGRAGIHPL